MRVSIILAFADSHGGARSAGLAADILLEGRSDDIRRKVLHGSWFRDGGCSCSRLHQRGHSGS